MPAEPKKESKYAQMYIRVPLDVRDAIKASAEENGRSLNSEIVHQLRRGYGLIAGKPKAPKLLDN